MSTKHLGAKKKRTNTPAMARQRAVAFRHSRYAIKNKVNTTVVPTEVVSKPTTVKVDTKSTKDIGKKIGGIFAGIGAAFAAKKTVEKVESNKTEIPKVEKPVVSKEEKKALKQETKAQKKSNKMARFEAEIQHYIDTPRTSVIRKIFSPIIAVDTEASVADETVSVTGYAYVLLLVKWILFAGIFFGKIREIITLNEFSTARFGFTDSATMSFEVAIYLYVSELVLYAVVSLLSKGIDKPVTYSKLLAIAMNASLNAIFVATIGLVVMMWKSNIGFAIGVSAIVLSAYYKAGGIHKVTGNLNFWRVCVLTIVFAILVFFFFQYIGLIGRKIISIFSELLVLK